MALSRDEFLEQWCAAGITPAETVASAVSTLSADLDSGEAIARELIRRKLLTAFQAQQLLAGRGASLILGNYVLTDKLGQGGMGMVLKAEHRRMKRVVALKVLSPSVVKTTELLQRFQREVEAAARLTHKNIVAAFDADETGGIHYLVMEFVPGRDLASYVKQNGPLTPPQALGLIRQAALGLEFAHQHGVIHRDIKPANLLLSTDGSIKILDMGLARLSTGGNEEGGQADLTNTGAVMGTVDYMSPEQALNTKHADERADIYSLGCTLHYLLTGRPVYAGGTLMEKILAHREAPIPSLASGLANAGAVTPAMREALDVVFHRMVAKRPEDRFESMGAVLTALQAVTVGAPVVVGPAELRPLGPAGEVAPSSDTRMADLAVATAASLNLPTAMERSIASKMRHRTEQPLDRRWWWIGGGLAVVALLVAALAPWLGSGKQTSAPPSNSPPLAKKTQTESVVEPALQNPALAQWPAGSVDRDWNGIITHPTKLPGIKRWQVETPAPRAAANFLSWSPDQTAFVVFSEDDRLRLYRFRDEKLELEAILPVDGRGILADLFWSPESRWIAWKMRSSEWVYTWDRTERRSGPQFECRANGGFAGWNPAGDLFAVGGTDKIGYGIQLWDWPKKTRHRMLRGLENIPDVVRWSGDGQRLAAAAWGGPTWIVAVDGSFETTLNLRTILLEWHPRDPLLAIIEQPGDQVIEVAVTNGDGQILSRRPTWPNSQRVAARWMTNDRQLLTNLDTGACELIRPDGTVLRGLENWSVWGLRLHASSGRFVALQAGNPLIDAATGTRLGGLNGPPIRCGDWSADGRWFAAVNEQGAVTVWDMERVRPLAALASNASLLDQVHWNHTGDALYTGEFLKPQLSGHSAIERWDLSGTRRWRQSLGDELDGLLQPLPEGDELLLYSDQRLHRIEGASGKRQASVDLPIERDHHLFAARVAPKGDQMAYAIAAPVLGRVHVRVGPPGGTNWKEVPVPEQSLPVSLCWNLQGDRFAVVYTNVASGSSSVHIYEPSRPSLVSQHQVPALRLSFAPHGKTLLTSQRYQSALVRVGVEEHQTAFWPLEIGRASNVWRADGARFVALALDESSKGIMGQHDPRTGLGELTWPWHNGNDVAFHASSGRLAGTRSDNVIGLWKLTADRVQPLWTALSLPDDQWACFSPGGLLLQSSPEAAGQLQVVLERDDGVIETIPFAEFGSRRTP